MFNKIILKGRKDAADFVWAGAKTPADVYLTIGHHSILSRREERQELIFHLPYNIYHVWVETDGAAYNLLKKFIEVADDDNASIHE